eukprot:11188922-Lingulodinium_polyedra.AAC.1
MSSLHARGSGRGQMFLPSSRAHGAQSDTNAILQPAFAHVDSYHSKGTDATDKRIAARTRGIRHARRLWPVYLQAA